MSMRLVKIDIVWYPSALADYLHDKENGNAFIRIYHYNALLFLVYPNKLIELQTIQYSKSRQDSYPTCNRFFYQTYPFIKNINSQYIVN